MVTFVIGWRGLLDRTADFIELGSGALTGGARAWLQTRLDLGLVLDETQECCALSPELCIMEKWLR